MKRFYLREPREFPWFLDKEHGDFLRALAESLTKDSQRLEGQDLIIDYYLSIHKKKPDSLKKLIDKYNSAGIAYIVSCLKNFTWTRFKTINRHQELEDDAATYKPIETDESQSPDADILAEDILNYFLSLLHREDYKAQFRLMAKGYSNKEIGEEMGMNCNTVATNKRRILAILRDSAE